MRTTAAVAARRAPARSADASHLEAFRSARFRSMLTPLLVANILVLPILIPRGAGNTALPDALMIPFTVVGAGALWRMRTRIRFPLGAFYLMIVLGGILAVTNSIVPRRSVMAIIQDGYLFLWFIVVLNYLRDGTGSAARLMAKTWVLAGVGVGLLTWVLRFFSADAPRWFGFPLVSSFGRVSSTFEDPNLAGNYLVVSLFVMWASPWPRTRTVKLALTVPFLLGIWATDSITAIVTLLGGMVAAVMIGYVSRRSIGIAGGLALAGLTLFGLTFLPADLPYRSGQLTQTIGSTGAFSGSLGRTDTSLSPRLRRIEDAFRYFGSDVFIGIGPSATEATLFRARAPIQGELHNDYAAGFIERGLVGGLGVLGLFAAAFWWSIKAGTDRSLRALGWWPAALTGAAIAVLLSSLSLETLHFRHVWAVFALMIALAIGTTATTNAGLPRPFEDEPADVRAVI